MKKKIRWHSCNFQRFLCWWLNNRSKIVCFTLIIQTTKNICANTIFFPFLLSSIFSNSTNSVSTCPLSSLLNLIHNLLIGKIDPWSIFRLVRTLLRLPKPKARFSIYKHKIYSWFVFNSIFALNLSFFFFATVIENLWLLHVSKQPIIQGGKVWDWLVGWCRE